MKWGARRHRSDGDGNTALVSAARAQRDAGRGFRYGLRKMARIRIAARTLVAALVLLMGSAVLAAEAPAPLDPESSRVFGLPEDEMVPEEYDKHFPRTNEWRLDVLFPALKDLGGGYVGVGSDQNYTLAAAAHSELVWLMDRDPVVRDLHRIYLSLIRASETADAFIERFSSTGRKEARRLIAAAYPDPRQHRPLIDRFNGFGSSQYPYFIKQRDRRSNGQPVTWLGDPELYRHVRALALAGRIHAVAGDLTGPTAMAQIATAARRLGVSVHVLYLSNAEDFFRHSSQSRANVANLPRDGRSLLVRTVIMRGLPRAKGSVWHYQTQVLDDYVAKLGRRHEYPSYRWMAADLRGPEGQRLIDAAGYSHITAELPRWNHLEPPPRAPTPARLPATSLSTTRGH
jgi:hypothetical protein